ncbi:MAG TPA: hypothetical protein VLY23_16565 [Candidatus Acidoferrum sp.]|nr:hypothetical protein [Candidatus Acidoferrum sp.]
MFRSLSLALLLATPLLLLTPAPAFAQLSVGVGVAVNLEPPELPVYDQPVCPGDGYIWVPGYWAWDGEDYYWVPGTWVEPPEVGFFWTPGYWAWNGGGYVFNAGYWGPVVGFYGGIDYGFGYFGHGYEGGRWEGRHFYYNTAVNNVNVTVIHNTYRTEVNNVHETRVSFNGGHGGINARASAEEEAAARERHVGPVSAQVKEVDKARSDRDFRASVNHGLPPVAATPKPGDFKASGVVKAREAGAVHEPAARPEERGAAHPEPNVARPEANPGSRPAVHARDLPPIEHPAAPNTGNPKLDQKYVQQQQKLEQKQQNDRQKLEQRQEKQDQQMAKQANAQKQQQLEMKHQQQTQQLLQKHQQQVRTMQQHQQPRPQAHPPKPPHPQH